MRNKAKNIKKFWPNYNPAAPFVFCDVIGTEKVTDTEFIDDIRVGQESKYNPKEADKIVRIVGINKSITNVATFCFRLKL